MDYVAITRWPSASYGLFVWTAVQYVKVEVREMKRSLNSVLDNYEALCKRIELQGPDFLRPINQPVSRAPSSSAEHLIGGALQHIFRTGSTQDTKAL